MALPYKKIVAGFIIGAFTLTGILATKPPDPVEGHYTNLKILSKKLTDEQMDQIMHQFNTDLGVTCKYCHVKKKNAPDPKPMDFASDERPEKVQARKMMAMAFRLNKKYFNLRLDGKLSVKSKIWCYTCHHGELINLKKPYDPSLSMVNP